MRSRVETILADVADAQHVVSVTSPFTPDGARQISADATTAYADVALDKTADELTADEAAALVAPILAAGDDTLQVEVGGPVATKSQTVAAGSEGIGLIAAAIILLITFGSVVAMGLPLITALFGLGIAMALGEVLRRVVDVPEWAPYTAAMVGIGVGIDYALLIVTRFRSSLADGQDPRGATQTAIATAGRSVLFAGLTVVISMLGILLMGQPAMNGFAFTVVLAVLVVMAATVTLLPAILGFAGRNIERLHVPFVTKGVRSYDASRWYRWSRFIQRRPWWAAIGSLAVLLALAAPFLGIRFGFPDAGNDSPTLTTRQAYDLLADGFGPGYAAPMLLTVQGPSGRRPARVRRRGRHRTGLGGRGGVRRPRDPEPGRRHRRVDADRHDLAAGRGDRRTSCSCSATRPSRRPPTAPASPSTSAASCRPTSTPPRASPRGCRSSSAGCCSCRSCC